ncbi:YheT family hydrolase [Pseudochryseolinea flava]|uniref:Alpha/beta hydrolase n=1 Tax=Pseudochryseolinea flava TaxID=2059302 RepID=A0A364XW65_9BACT|nr:alpha/beta fold hydrolase [Pseudochryseolinea flava]RAV98597.1 alpha/beta hydrolase [Pseudochryseolinea flava]
MNPYQPPTILFNAHLETIFPSLLRKVSFQQAQRERIVTPDNDFLDLDWYRQNSKKLLIISHGLEGNSTRTYVLGLARAGYLAGFDILAWNFRGCSGEINKQLRFYHSGATDDLLTIVNHARLQYNEIYLAGFSLGGNLTLKFLGEPVDHSHIKKAVVFSVPLNLHTSCQRIGERSNWIYERRFLNSLKKKVLAKAKFYPELDTRKLMAITDLKTFDDQYTAPLHGFKDAIAYYEACSSLYFLKHINIPTLIVNAKNDPFLSSDCFPEDILTDHPVVTLETPIFGGHVGFAQFNKNGLYWSEERAIKFFTQS